MSFSWIVAINILSVIFYFVNIISAVLELFRKIREYCLESNQNLEAACIIASTYTSMYIQYLITNYILYSLIIIF